MRILIYENTIAILKSVASVERGARAGLVAGLCLLLTGPAWAAPGGSINGSSPRRAEREASDCAGSAQGDVLTLGEAALWLRVEPEQLEALARSGTIPGRQIGEHWRFSRAALRVWLAAIARREDIESAEPDLEDAGTSSTRRSATAEPRPTIGEPTSGGATTLAAGELAAITGRGPGTGEAAEGGAPSSKAGEAPSALTAEQVFLRHGRILLGRGQFIVEPLVAYARGDDIELRGIHFEVGNITLDIPQLFRLQEDTTEGSLNVRYGLFDETELYAEARYRYRNPTERSHRGGGASATPAGIDPERPSHLARLYLGARRTVLKERSGVPDLVVSLEGGIPLHDTSGSIGGGLWAVKSYDPISLFAGAEYRHVFSRHLNQLNKLEPENIGGLSAGYAFSVNDQLTLSMALLASFSSRTDFGSGLVMQKSQSYGLRFGLTHMLRKNLYLDPHITIGLNGPGSWVRFGLSLPMTFD